MRARRGQSGWRCRGCACSCSLPAPSSADDRRRAVARAADRRDVAGRVGIVAELVAQPADVDVDRSVEDLRLLGAPDRVEELVAAENPAVGLEEGLEKTELDVGQPDE